MVVSGVNGWMIQGNNIMKFKIHFEYANDEYGYAIIEGDTIEEIQEKSEKFVKSRNAKNYWSEEIKD